MDDGEIVVVVAVVVGRKQKQSQENIRFVQRGRFMV